MVAALRVVALEDRIVYDGAVAHDVVAHAAAPVTGFSTVPAPVSNADALANLPPPNVLVISEHLPMSPDLVQAAKSNTRVVNYNPDTETLDQLSTQILQALNGEKAANIGFATEGAQGKIQLLSTLEVTDQTLKSSPDDPVKAQVINFLQGISKNLVPNGSVDLFGSNIAEGAPGQQFLTDFAKELNSFSNPLSVHASTDETGATSLGGNWNLESSSDGTNTLPYTSDAASSYFNETTLANYIGLLAPSVLLSTTTTLYTTDSGGYSSFTVSLSSQPDSDVTIPLSVSNPNEGSLSVYTLTFSPSN